MPLPMLHRARYAYQFVHLDNLPNILEHGLLSNTRLRANGISPRSIAAPDIQVTRAQMAVTCGPMGIVHDYVPFYICKRSSMLLSVVNAKNVDQQFLIYLAVPLGVIESDRVVFSDAAANRKSDPPNFYSSPDDLDKLDWASIDSMKWSLSDAQNHSRMAEVLIHDYLPIDALSHIIVWNDSFGDEVKTAFTNAGLESPQIICDPRHYFTRYPKESTRSLVTGPYFAKQQYQETVDRVLKNIGNATDPQFGKLFELRNALRADLSCLKETAELVGLKAESALHGDLGEHTEKVADTLRKSEEFAELDKIDRMLVEIAAYLHDIGKGPKSRWTADGGKYQNDDDHPLTALPMVERILTEEVGGMQRRSAETICKLVAYHDLIGGIIGKGRDPEQLYEIIDDQRELDMLIALTKADTLAVFAGWWNSNAVNQFRDNAMAQLSSRDDDEEA